MHINFFLSFFFFFFSFLSFLSFLFLFLSLFPFFSSFHFLIHTLGGYLLDQFAWLNHLSPLLSPSFFLFPVLFSSLLALTVFPSSSGWHNTFSFTHLRDTTSINSICSVFTWSLSLQCGTWKSAHSLVSYCFY